MLSVNIFLVKKLRYMVVAEINGLWVTYLETDVTIFLMTYSCQHHLRNLKGILQFNMRKKLKSSELNWTKRYVASTCLFKFCTQTFHFEQVIFCASVKDEDTFCTSLSCCCCCCCCVQVFMHCNHFLTECDVTRSKETFTISFTA